MFSMTTFAHVGGGIVVAAAVQHFVFREEITASTIVVGALIGLMPDLDSIFALLFGKWSLGAGQLSHHQYFTHTPLFFLVLLGLLWLAAGWKWAVMFGAVTLTHLLFDSWSTDDGIMWLWPFRSQQYSLFPIGIHSGGIYGLQFYSRYARTPRLILPELVLVAGGVYVIFRYLFSR
jgi:hypothetical protein